MAAVLSRGRRAPTLLLRLLLMAALLYAAHAWSFGSKNKAAADKKAPAKTVSKLQIGVKRRATCERAAQDGDHVYVHYRGTLLATGEQFDASCARLCALAARGGLLVHVLCVG